MTDFVETTGTADREKVGAGGESTQQTVLIDFASPVRVRYCGVCSMPPEFCEFGSCFDKCLPWIADNCPDVLSEDVLATMVGKVSVREEGDETQQDAPVVEKRKKKGAAAPKKPVQMDTRVVITRVQRQKRKFVTVVAGLETVPDLKIKDAAKAFGRKFSSGSSVNDGNGGSKEVVIQGDVINDLPQMLIHDFKISSSAIFILEDGTLRPIA